MLQFAGSGGSMQREQQQQQANGAGGSKHGDAAALIALAGAAGLPDGPAGYPFKPEGSNGSDQTGQRRAFALQTRFDFAHHVVVRTRTAGHGTHDIMSPFAPSVQEPAEGGVFQKDMSSLMSLTVNLSVCLLRAQEAGY